MQGLFEGDPLEHFGFDHCFQGVQVRGQAPGKLVGGTGRPTPSGLRMKSCRPSSFKRCGSARSLSAGTSPGGRLPW